MASNQPAKERVQAMQSLMEHVITVASVVKMRVIVEAMSVHTGTRKAKGMFRKARTARTRKAKASKRDPWTMLEDYLTWERWMQNKVELFVSLIRWNRYSTYARNLVT